MEASGATDPNLDAQTRIRDFFQVLGGINHTIDAINHEVLLAGNQHLPTLETNPRLTNPKVSPADQFAEKNIRSDILGQRTAHSYPRESDYLDQNAFPSASSRF